MDSMARETLVPERAVRTQSSKPSTDSTPVSRRSILRIAGAGATAAVVGLGSNTVSAENGEYLLDIDYDEYADPSDVYRVWTCSPDQASFTNEHTHTGNSAMEIALQSGGSCGTNTHFNLENELGSQPTEIYDSFMFRLSDNWQMAANDQCKISRAAMSYSAGDGHSGGDSATGENGWSAGLVLANRGSGAQNDGPYNLAAYVYHLDTTAQDNSGPWETTMIEPGRWYHIEQYIRLNTVASDGSANRDGVYRVWVDGELGFERDYRWTTDLENNAIEYCGPYIRYGGGETSPRTMAAYYDDHTMYVGGMPEESDLERPDSGDDESDEDESDEADEPTAPTGDFTLEITGTDPLNEYVIAFDAETVDPGLNANTHEHEYQDRTVERDGYWYAHGYTTDSGIDDFEVVDGEITAIGFPQGGAEITANGDVIDVDAFDSIEAVPEEEDLLEVYDERLTYRDPGEETEYTLYVEGEIVQHDWGQATENETVGITTEGAYEVVTATSDGENVDGYVFDGEVVAIDTGGTPRLWISGDQLELEDYPSEPPTDDDNGSGDDDQDDSDGSSIVDEYRNEDGEVDNAGVLKALDDYRDGEISAAELSNVRDEWRSS